MNIVLIGFMAAGKSTVGKHLSQKFNADLVEMDDLVCSYAKCNTMHQVIEKGGEILLRETEIAIAKEYSLKKNQIISTGGGVVLNKIVLDYFKQRGATIIFLNTTFDLIAKRLENDTARPLLKQGSEAKKLYDFRLPLYLHYADRVIRIENEPAEEIALTIEQVMNLYGL